MVETFVHCAVTEMRSVERDIIIMTQCLCFMWNDGVVTVVMSLWFGPPQSPRRLYVD